jgi:hypothetical protein
MPHPLHFLAPGSQQLIQPGMTPVQQARVLQQHQMPGEAVKSLAHGLPEKDSVKWASLSAEKVSSPAHPGDLAAIQAAKNWSQNPSPATQQAAGQAALKAGHNTPGAWAAQGAAWSGTGHTPHAVTGSVMLAAAQAGKPVPPTGVAPPPLVAPQIPQPPKPTAPKFQLPFFKKPAPPAPPEVPVKGPDGLTLTPAQRAQMTKNTDPFINLGCDIGQGKA